MTIFRFMTQLMPVQIESRNLAVFPLNHFRQGNGCAIHPVFETHEPFRDGIDAVGASGNPRLMAWHSIRKHWSWMPSPFRLAIS